MKENLLSREGINHLQSRKEMHLLEGAYWAVVKGTTLNLILLFLTWIFDIARCDTPMGCEGVTFSSL